MKKDRVRRHYRATAVKAEEDRTEERIAKDKIRRLFRFVSDYIGIRYPVDRDLDRVRWKLWLDELPLHPSIQVMRLAADQESIETSGESPAVVMRVRRPVVSRPPEPPPSIKDWVYGYDDPFKEPQIRAERETSRVLERFEQSERRALDLADWLQRWHRWADEEKPVRIAVEVYHRFYELYGELLREGESVALFLGDGILLWRWHSGKIYFPLILMPVQLEFDPNVPEFIVRETDRGPELHKAILLDAPLRDRSVLHSYVQQKEEAATPFFIHPLEETNTTAFLKGLARVLAPDGEFVGKPVGVRQDSENCPPRIWRSPVLVLLPRTHGYKQMAEKVLEDIDRRDAFSVALHAIVGAGQPELRDAQHGGDQFLSSDDDLAILKKVFLTKPWNREQLQIAARLERHKCVVVQGPPGTGKTHTIANLIGHLLAEGKSVLVTAHTSKALRVVRDHIHESLRSLAISVLDNDLESRRQLEEAVTTITSQLDRDPRALHRRADELEGQRARLIDQIARLRGQLIEAVGAEYRSIVVSGKEYAPSEAARIVAEGTGRDDWIPGHVEPNSPLPLTREELAELYRLNQELTEEDERELRAQVPDPSTLLNPDDFEELLKFLGEKAPHHRANWWDKEPSLEGLPALHEAAEAALSLGEFLLSLEPWELRLIEKGEERQFEKFLFSPAKKLVEFRKLKEHLLLTHKVDLPRFGTLDEHIETARKLARVARRRGGKLCWLDSVLLAVVRRYRLFVDSSRVDGEKPRTAEHFEALEAYAQVEKQRRVLRTAWDSLIGDYGGPRADDLGPEPEKEICGRAEDMRRLLSVKERIRSIKDKLRGCGLSYERAWADFRRGQNADATGKPIAGGSKQDSVSEWRLLGEFLSRSLQEGLRAAELLSRQRYAEARIREVNERLEGYPAGTAAAALRDAIEKKDGAAYRAAYNRVTELYDKLDRFRRREVLLERLFVSAPDWAEAVRERRDVHGGAELPGDPEAAWLWKQLSEELRRRSSLNISEIQKRLEEAMTQLRDLTAQLVECRTWAYLIEKTTKDHRSALVGWLNTMRRLGKGTGRTAARLRREAQRLLAKAKDAVPVWIMPLARVVEQMDPATTRFDVVIIDEASQADFLALLALYIADQVVVVGDHEQVSPEGVGLDLSRIEHLQHQHLSGIPNYHLYDGRRSIYDIAREAFGGTLMLTEHFRCVPEIIEFSNRLCYSRRIRPLRESGSSPLKPAVVPYRVTGVAYDKVNEQEALTVSALVLSMLEHPSYAEKTLGVISMVGDEQAKLIERLIFRKCLEDPRLERELERRRLLCGNPAQFQGDERDVVLISLVDSPKPGGPLPLRNEDRFKQRFNVAASRARDQLWVVYSLDPAVDLKEGDLRRELIEFALQVYEAPESLIDDAETARAESPFEREVLQWLRSRGYRVYSQWQVGSYRIDIVVEYRGRRIAIECDGDRWHPIEKISEDLERQAVLERLGWRFIRIRGSEFYRDREGTMERVVRELKRLEIEPEGRFVAPDRPMSRSVSYRLVEELKAKAVHFKRELEEKLRAERTWSARLA